MKQLRILTGRHAGAHLRLTHRRYALGAGDDSDVQISDWKQQPVILTVDEDNDVIRMAIEAAGAGAARRETVLEDYMPRRFDDIVLCVGAADDHAWPGDVELLKRLLRTPRKRAPQAGAAAPRKGRGAMGLMAIAGSVAGTLLLAAFATLAMQGTRGAEAHARKPPLQARVAGALAREGLNGLSVAEAGEAKVVVSGLVTSLPELERAHAALRPFGEAAVLRRYASADDLVRSISDALAAPALQVRYEGGGVFLVQGAAADVDALRSSVNHIGADIGPLVKRIDIDVKELPPAERTHLDAMLMSPDLQYVQTPDGTKHLVVVSPAASDPTADR